MISAQIAKMITELPRPTDSDESYELMLIMHDILNNAFRGMSYLKVSKRLKKQTLKTIIDLGFSFDVYCEGKIVKKRYKEDKDCNTYEHPDGYIVMDVPEEDLLYTIKWSDA